MMIGIILSVLIPLAIGYALVSLIASLRSNFSFWERIAFSYPLGAGVITLQMAVWPLLKIPYSALGLAIPWLVTGGIVIALPRFRSRLAASAVIAPWTRLTVIIAGWLALKTAWLLGQIALRPVNAWDAVAYWSHMAKLFFYERTWSPALADLTRGGSQPLFNPLIQTWTGVAMGNWNENWIQLPFALLFISLVAAMGVVIARVGGSRAGWIAAALMMGLPFAAFHAIMAYSDLPLAVLHGLAYLMLFLYARERDKRTLILSAVFILLTIWAKRHGIIYTGVWGICAAAVEMRGRMPTKIPSLAWLIGAGGGVALAVLFWLRIGTLADWGWHIDRLPVIAPFLMARLFTYGHWNVLWALALWAAVAAWIAPDTQSRRLFSTLPWAMVMMLGLFYSVAGDELYRWFLDGTVINRYVLHIVPLAVLAVAGLFVDTPNERTL